LLYKRLEDGRFDWPRTPAQAANLTPEQYHYLLIGLNPLKPKIKQVNPQHVY
ncbi:MAG: IS66 family insertion sequence element accessory protein TnpB, partial [Butyrivibrio sp.]|nr:IS66 family insertion sequence element accessory protein TnpB [Butyrivibrio sp.]